MGSEELTQTTITLDSEHIEALRTPQGGFTKALTDELGIAYPYKGKWLKELKKEKRVVTTDYYFKLHGLSEKYSKVTLKRLSKSNSHY
jgi:hypothetical protein